MASQFVRGTGGQFNGSTGGGVQVPAALQQAFNQLGGPMSYNPKSNKGTGYGHKAGDPRVTLLQQALNRAGFTDMHGKPLMADGKLGPLTTSAIKSAQRALGLDPDGVVTPELMTQILGMPPAPPKKPVSARAKMRTKPAVKPQPKKPTKPSAQTPAPTKAVPRRVGGAHVYAV